ncbi:MAG: S8 family serine peptidase [Planctomycetota bacterium]
MPKADRPLRPARRTQIETLEDRVVMSADPLGGLLGGTFSHHAIVEDEPGPLFQHTPIDTAAPPLSQHGLLDELPPLSHQTEPTPDFWLDPVADSAVSLEDSLNQIDKSLASAHGQTGLNNVRTDYGFDGGGQTVVVIDSGIAYDHYALGGGYGSNYRVVGGWDFTEENDADPYDDAGSGSHGTHVAGIIGSTDSTHQGVAPGVDLVGLRVFNDAGAGYFSWLENALQWVHDNRDSFENPITTVNMSLGTNWNSDSIPSWAMLEDEFAQLEADGIFISVSAGNRFASYNTPGLSYPAASPHVVPVMSMDDSGMLSYFSQRHQTAIAAPGRYITSSVADHSGNNNGIADDFGSMSGTSMAAPYVAGASTLIREAMEFVGMTNIDQDTIYAHMLATSDTINDAATGLSYSRLNVEAAIDALMPTDDYGSSQAAAYNLGTISGSLSTSSLMSMNGVISTLTDSDYFTFTAGTTGTVTFTASNTTHDLDATWQGFGGVGWSDSTGDVYTMNVVAGQQYTVSLGSGDGLGYYNLDVSAEATFSYTDWGTVTGQQQQTSLTSSGPAWYKFTAGQTGILSAVLSGDSQSLNLDYYDSNLAAISTSFANDRADLVTTAGTDYYLRIDGSSSGFDIDLMNLVGTSGSTVTVTGTSGNDSLSFTAGTTTHTVSVNGLSYTFDASQYDTFALNGGSGSDTVTLTGSSAADTAVLGGATSSLTSANYSVTVTGATQTDVVGRGGTDSATIADSSGDDTLVASGQWARLTGGGFSNSAAQFESITVTASTGYDRATFNGGAGDDVFRGWSDRAKILGTGYDTEARGFNRVTANGGGGNDTAQLYDSTGGDTLVSRSDQTMLYGSGFHNEARSFGAVYAYATTGSDIAFMYDTTGDDTFTASSTSAQFTGQGYTSYAEGFGDVFAFSTGGTDTANLSGGAGDDLFRGWSDNAQLSGSGYSNRVYGFAQTTATAGESGNDIALLFDTAGDETLTAQSDRVSFGNANYTNTARDFSFVYSFATSGNDTAVFYDTAGDDIYSAGPTWARMSGSGYFNYAGGFDQTTAYSTSGYDRAYLYDSTGDDTFTGSRTSSRMSGSGYSNTASGFDKALGFASLGNDTATLTDSSADDTLYAQSWRALLLGSDYSTEVRGFDSVTARSVNGGVDNSFVEAADYALTEVGNWV